jgi:Oxidoreductase molybdopterin binding domain/Pentapeptide repeats (8 copies)
MTDKSRLSPGQSLTRLFPPVGEEKPSSQISEWSLKITGLVSSELQFSLAEFQRLPMVERVWDTICVTGWTHLDHHWSGVLLDTLFAIAEPLSEARFVRFVAYSNRGHDTSLPLDYARAHVLLATKVDGEPLTEIHGAPVRTVCEGKYFYKSLKWVREIELLAEDRLGYWERESAYHNNADPWLEQRLVPQPIAADEFARRLAGLNFSEAFAIKDDQFEKLRDMDLANANFKGAQIKACNLSGVTLRGANCRGANFTLTKFVDADLRDADLSNGDCEGADFRGADLRDADFRGTSLTVARFAKRNADIRGAKFRHKDIEKEGLGEEEQAFILDEKQGAVIE